VTSHAVWLEAWSSRWQCPCTDYNVGHISTSNISGFINNNTDRIGPKTSRYPKQDAHTGCPRVAGELHNLFVIKDVNFFFVLDDSYASAACSEGVAVYI
jgi:hypothetical protein